MLISFITIALAIAGSTECEEGASCSASGTVGQALLQAKTTITTDVSDDKDDVEDEEEMMLDEDDEEDDVAENEAGYKVPYDPELPPCIFCPGTVFPTEDYYYYECMHNWGEKTGRRRCTAGNGLKEGCIFMYDSCPEDRGAWVPNGSGDGEDYYVGGQTEEKEEPAWVKAVPEGMNKVENWDKDDCQKQCIKMGQALFEKAGKGVCEYCGKGNACCKWNDPLAPKECSGVEEDQYKDEWGFTQMGKMMCVYPKESNISNYQKYKDDTWAAAMKLLGGKQEASEMSKMRAPKMSAMAAFAKKKGYQVFEGKGKPEYFLGVAVGENSTEDEDGGKVKAACSAYKNEKYGLSNGGLFDNMTYYSYPYWTASGSELQIKEFCGARYTDDPSKKTQQAAAKMARKACDDMGDKCGGYSVGADPECCGNTGCTEVVFLGPGANEGESKVIDTKPQSFKTGKFICNYLTYIKQ